MPTLQQVHAQIKALPHKYIFYTKKEIKYLPKILAEDEVIKALTSGFMDNKTWLAVCTNRRIIFINAGMFFGLQTVQMNLDRVQSIDSSYIIYFGSIRFWDGASSFELKMILKDSIDPFVKTVRDEIDAYRKLMFKDITSNAHTQQQSLPQQHAQPTMPISQPVTGQSDVASQLERLVALKEAGHLTEEEFAAQKQKLLAT